MVLRYGIQEYTTTLVYIYGRNVTLNLNGHSLKNTNPNGNGTIYVSGPSYGTRIINGTLVGAGVAQEAILSYSDHLEITDVKIEGTFGTGLRLGSDSDQAVAKVKNFNFTQTDIETSSNAIYVTGNMHAYFENVNVTGGSHGGAPLYLNGSAKVSFISGSITSQREVNGTGKGLLIIHRDVTAAECVGDYLYDGCTASIDGTSVPNSTALDSYTSGSQQYNRLLGWKITVTSGIDTAAPVIITQPTDRSVGEGGWVNFSLTAVGKNLTYEWMTYEIVTVGGVPMRQWVPFNYNVVHNGMNTDAMGFDTKPGLNGKEIMCKVSNSYGTVYSDVVTLTLQDVKPSIKSEPESVKVVEGETVKFTTEIWGGHLTYQWYYRKSSSDSWKECTGTGYNKRILTVEAKAYRNGYQYRCTAANSVGSATTNIVTLTVLSKPSITTQPVSVTISEGGYVAFPITATGGDLSYQWYYRTSGTGTWKKSTMDGATTATLIVQATSARNGYQYKCKVTNAAGYKYTNAVTLTVTAAPKPKITTQPASKSVSAGTTVKFTVKASGDNLSYQWYYRTSSTGTWKKSTLTGATTATLTVSATAARNGYQYRCKVSNDYGYVYSNAATLTVK
ncbi:MAG: immunoglobulin domain-containing protein [Oscillospiraceae bacterium]|nr:immunoglobulin domain-containing protein [Oscillospiraceae bacterium]